MNPGHRGRWGHAAGAEHGHREGSVAPQGGCGPKTHPWGRSVAPSQTWCAWAPTPRGGLPPCGGFGRDESTEQFEKSDLKKKKTENNPFGQSTGNQVGKGLFHGPANTHVPVSSHGWKSRGPVCSARNAHIGFFPSLPALSLNVPNSELERVFFFLLPSAF